MVDLDALANAFLDAGYDDRWVLREANAVTLFSESGDGYMDFWPDGTVQRYVADATGPYWMNAREIFRKHVEGA